MKRAVRMALALGLALHAAVAGAKGSEEEEARLGTDEQAAAHLVGLRGAALVAVGQPGLGRPFLQEARELAPERQYERADRTVSANSMAPAHTSAENSPRE